jgi:hypothetical protein
MGKSSDTTARLNGSLGLDNEAGAQKFVYGGNQRSNIDVFRSIFKLNWLLKSITKIVRITRPTRLYMILSTGMPGNFACNSAKLNCRKNRYAQYPPTIENTVKTIIST